MNCCFCDAPLFSVSDSFSTYCEKLNCLFIQYDINRNIIYYRLSFGHEYTIKSGLTSNTGSFLIGTYFYINMTDDRRPALKLDSYIPLIIENDKIINAEAILNKLKKLMVFS